MANRIPMPQQEAHAGTDRPQPWAGMTPPRPGPTGPSRAIPRVPTLDFPMPPVPRSSDPSPRLRFTTRPR